MSKIKLIVEVDEKTVCKGFEQPLTDEERASLIRAIGNGKPYTEPTGDLISREALKEELNSRPFPQDYSTTLLLGVFNELIDNAPSVELSMGRMVNGVIIPIKRPQGEWVFDSECTELGNPYGTYRCSVCGGHSSAKYSFCKDCGAEMRRGDIE